MNKWHSESFGDLTINFDSVRIPVKEADRQSGPYPYYGASGVVDYTDNFLFDGEYLLIAEDGENLRTRNTPIAFIVNGKFWVNNHAHIVTGNDNADTRFLLYALLSLDISSYLTGSTMPKLTQGNLNNISLLVPPLPEQRRIAHILGTLDDKIENNRKMAKTLEAMAQAIFQSWFVDFDPVRAKMAGESPESICKRLKLTPEILDLFPDKLVDSELGEIPEGWVVRSLDNIGNFLNGLALQKFPSKGQDDALPVIKIAQLRSGNLGGADQASCEIEPQYIVHDGDILFSWSGSLECAIWSGGTGALNQHLFKVTPKSDYPRWLCYFGVHHFLDFFREIAAGKATTMGHIQRHHLSDSKLPFPCSGTLDVMNKPLSSMFEVMWMKTVEEQKLVFLRDTLLPKLISGEIRVLDERTIENDRAYPWIK